jgi:hypothetical protein
VLDLRDLQERFLTSIAAAPGSSASRCFDPALLRLVAGADQLGPAARLDVYAQMYWMRLHDVLCEDFPRVAAILGAERFGAVVRRYLARHPSTHPSVRHVGGCFAEFLAEIPETKRWPFLSDLARLEWSRLAVFDAPDAPALHLDDLRAIAPDEWPRLTLEMVPAVRSERFAWPVHDLWATVDERPDEPAHPADTHLRIWRDGFRVYQASMDACERRAFESVGAGESFATMCAALESPAGGPEEAARQAAQLVLRWVEDGFVACLHARSGRGDARAGS